MKNYDELVPKDFLLFSSSFMSLLSKVGYCQGSAFIVGLLLMQVNAALHNICARNLILIMILNMIIIIILNHYNDPDPDPDIGPDHVLEPDPDPDPEHNDQQSELQMPEEEAFTVLVRIMQEYRSVS